MFNALTQIDSQDWIPIVVVPSLCVVFIVVFVVKAIHRHEERMEMIKRGMDPSKIGDKK
jgi:hypothetical protein